MAITRFGWKFSMGVLAAMSCLPSIAWAEASDTPATGPLIKLEVNAAGPGFAMQTTSFEDATGGSAEQFSFASPMLVFGPVVGLNLGYAPSQKLRVGLRGTASGTAVLAGGDGIPYTDFNAVMRLTGGPTVGFRFGPASPFELEFGLAFAGQMMAGGQVGIGAPDNGYPLGAAQYGVDALARAIWRPWGARSLIGFNFGVDVGWAAVPSGSSSTHAFLFTPEAGVVLGL